MADLPERRSLLSRAELSHVSRWVWLLLGLATALAGLTLAQVTIITFDSVLSAFVAAAPLVTAAALMYAAPRERRVVVAASAFAVLPTVRVVEFAFLNGRFLLPPWLPDADYLTITQRLHDVYQTVGDFSWLLTVVAVLCLAFQIGIVRSRLGWFIVAVGGASAVVYALRALPVFAPLLNLAPLPGELSAGQLVLYVLGALPLAAWGYLAAVALDRRLVLLALAAGLLMASGVLSLVEVSVLQAFPPDESLSNSIQFGLIVLFEGLHLVVWALLIAGILRELPRRAGEEVVGPVRAQVA